MKTRRHFHTISDTPNPDRAAQSDEIAEQIAAFKKRGGRITVLDNGATTISQNMTRREQNERSMNRRVELQLGNKREA